MMAYENWLLMWPKFPDNSLAVEEMLQKRQLGNQPDQESNPGLLDER